MLHVPPRLWHKPKGRVMRTFRASAVRFNFSYVAAFFVPFWAFVPMGCLLSFGTPLVGAQSDAQPSQVSPHSEPQGSSQVPPQGSPQVPPQGSPQVPPAPA